MSYIFTELLYLGYAYMVQTVSIEVPYGIWRDLLIEHLVLHKTKFTGLYLARLDLDRLYLEEDAFRQPRTSYGSYHIRWIYNLLI